MVRIAMFVLIGFAVSLVSSATAEAGPLCGLLRGAARVATAPIRGAARARDNRYEARQSRYERRAAAACDK